MNDMLSNQSINQACATQKSKRAQTTKYVFRGLHILLELKVYHLPRSKNKHIEKNNSIAVNLR